MTTDETRRLHCSEKTATFFSEEEATGLNNAMDKNTICSRGNVCNFNSKIIIVHCLQELIVWLINQNLTKTQIFLNRKLALLYSDAGNRLSELCNNFKIFF